jgi:hypothetical protein
MQLSKSPEWGVSGLYTYQIKRNTNGEAGRRSIIHQGLPKYEVVGAENHTLVYST